MPILIHGAGLTAEEIGALPLTGGTMTGGLSVPSLTLNGLLATISVSDPNELCMTTNPGDEEPVLLGFIKTPTQDYHAANKAYVDGKVLVFAGKTVATTRWTSNTTYSAQGYNWRAAVICSGVTDSHRPDVAFSAADAMSGNFAPVADSYVGGVYVYCKTKPTTTITIQSIICVKGV